MPDPERHVVRPRPWKLLLYLLGVLAFVAVGVFLIVDGSIVEIVVGVVTIAFFGGGLLLAVLVNVRRGRLSQLTLTRTGVELAAGGTIPWEDVESVGVTKDPTTMVWFRLRDYDRYLASLTPEGRRDAGWLIRFMKPFGYLLRWLPSMRRYTEQVRDPEDLLRWNRQEFGYDLGFSPAFLDRSPERFVDLVERYRGASGAG